MLYDMSHKIDHQASVIWLHSPYQLSYLLHSLYFCLQFSLVFIIPVCGCIYFAELVAAANITRSRGDGLMSAGHSQVHFHAKCGQAAGFQVRIYALGSTRFELCMPEIDTLKPENSLRRWTLGSQSYF